MILMNSLNFWGERSLPYFLLISYFKSLKIAEGFLLA